MKNGKMIEPGKWYCIFDENGNCTDAFYDISFRKILGFYSEEDYANTQETWTSNIHPDDDERVNRHLEECLKKHPEGMEFDIEYRMMTKTVYRWFHDFGHCTRREDGSVLRIDGVVFDIHDIIEKVDKHKLISEINSCMFALEDNFQSLYDVELESGRYEVFTKGDFYTNNVLNKLQRANNYFDDLQDNVESVIYEDDRAELLKILSKESLIKNLGENDHFDHYYRIKTDSDPVWFKLRLVYKNSDRKNVIIGVFDSSDEMAAREKKAQELQETELKLKHEKLRRDILNFMIDNEEDPIELLKHYAEQIRILIGCDQVIYRDLEETRIMVNSEGIADTWSVPIEYCRQCQHFNAHHPMYKDGYTEMENCKEGWNGIPVYEKCPIKSSYTKIVYCDGETAGYLAIHYVQNYHRFTDLERETIGIFARILSISLSRFKAKSENKELRIIQEMQEELKIAYEKVNDVNRRIVLLHNALKASMWSYDINSEDEIISAEYDIYAEKKTMISSNGDPMNWINFLHPEDRQRVLDEFMASVHDHSGNTPYETTYRFLKNNEDEYLWVKTSGRIVHNEDGTSELIGISVDITENIEEQNKRAEEAEEAKKLIEKIAASYKDALNIVNEEKRRNDILHDIIHSGKWSFFINSENEITGSEYSDELKRVINNDLTEGAFDWINIIHPEDKDMVYGAFKAAISDKSGKTPYDVAFRMADRNGEYHWFHSAGRIVRDPEGKGEFFGIHIDITSQIEEQLKQQNLLNEALVAADAANKAKSSFLFNMSHDIRTPMNAIRGFTAMAKKNSGDENKVVEYLNKIDISGQQLLTLINQVLEMARIESGKIEFNERPVNILEEFNSLVIVLAEQANTKGLNFTYSLGNVKHYNVLADEARMNSITLNIIGNAMKYTPEGGSIEYKLWEIESRKHGYASFVFTVSDTGIGMSKEYLNELYEPFSREKNSTVSKIQGTGLGLSIVKNIIDLMGGEIKVQSELGKGTKFELTVDFKIDEDFVIKSKEKEKSEKFTYEGMKVLLVEDNEMNREIARDVLEEQGFVVEDACDGDIAVDIIKDSVARGEPDYFDFILIDVQMPRMNGYDATKAIRELQNPLGIHTPIIAMTANAFEEDRMDALAAGMDEHLSKPLDVQQMMKTIAKIM